MASSCGSKESETLSREATSRSNGVANKRISIGALLDKSACSSKCAYLSTHVGVLFVDRGIAISIACWLYLASVASRAISIFQTLTRVYGLFCWRVTHSHLRVIRVLPTSLIRKF
eukprot:6207071-Pleurochrysis_carterae.AAC.1